MTEHNSDYFERELKGIRGKPFKQKVAKTLVINVRYKPTSLATLAKHMELSGRKVTSQSQVICDSLEDLVGVVKELNPTAYFNDSQQAISYLEELGILSRSETNQKRLFNITSLESLTNTQNQSQCQEQDYFSDELIMARTAVISMFEIGITPGQEQLAMAKMTMSNGKPVPNEQINKCSEVNRDEISQAKNEAECSPFELSKDEWKKQMLLGPKMKEGENDK